jgi:hypothetical protein
MLGNYRVFSAQLHGVSYTHLCNETGTKPAEQPQFKYSSEEMSQHLKEFDIQRHLREVEDNI